MESGALKPDTMQHILLIIVCEAAGTFILINGVALAQGINAGFIVAGMFFIAISTFGRVTGAHLNGAVTLGVYIIEGKWGENIKTVLIYFGAQTLGAYIGLFVANKMLTAN